MSGKPIVVVGGGIAGLAAAHRLVELGSGSGALPPVLLLEAGDRLGGQIRTDRVGDLLLEGGPDTLVAQKPAGIRLCERLGLGAEIEDLAGRHLGTEILWSGRLHRVPEGFAMIAPTRLLPAWRSSLFSWRGKLRMAAERLVPPRAEAVDDESLASFVTRRFGREVLERAAEPIAASLFTADADRLSLRMTMPRFLDVERKHGSLHRGLAASLPPNHAPSTARPGAFVALRGGLGRLVEALAGRLPPGTARTGARVEEIARSVADGSLALRLAGGETVSAEAVILASPAYASSIALRRAAPALSRLLDRLPYASCATVTLIYPREALARPLASFGFFVPRVVGLPLLACSYVSEKFPARAPRESVVLRAFLGGAMHPEILDIGDEGLAATAHWFLRRILRLSGEPRAAYVYRYPRAMPQYEVGAAAWLAEAARETAAIPGLAIAGSAAGAVGVPDAVRSGEEAAERLAASPGASAWVAYQANQKA